MPPKKQSLVSEQELIRTYSLIFQILESDYSGLKITYNQLLYLLLDRRVQLQKIAYFRHKKYDAKKPIKSDKIKELPKVQQEDSIISDAIQLGREVINNEWRWRNLKLLQPAFIQKQHKQTRQSQSKQAREIKPQIQQTQNQEGDKKQQLVEQSINQVQPQFQEKSPSKKAVTSSKNNKKNERKLIEDQLANLQKKINESRNEEDIATNQKQYAKMFHKLTTLQNIRRMKQQQKSRKQACKEITQIGDKVPIMLEEIHQKVLNLKREQNKKIKVSASISHMNLMSKDEEMFRIKQIFYYYTRQQASNKNRYFSDMSKQFTKLYQQSFIKFAKQWNLQRVISLDRISGIFKKLSTSKGNKYIQETDFVEIFGEIHRQECQEEDKQFNSATLSHYLQQYIVSDPKINKLVNKKIDNFRSKRYNSEYSSQPQSSRKYNFQIAAHSGKLASSIKEEIQEKKQVIEHLSGLKNVIKFKERKRIKTLAGQINGKKQSTSIDRTFNGSSMNSNLDTKSRNIHSRNKSPDFRNTNNSYLSRYRSGKNRHIRAENLRSKMLGEIFDIEKLQENMREKKNPGKQSQKDEQFGEITNIPINPYYPQNSGSAERQSKQHLFSRYHTIVDSTNQPNPKKKLQTLPTELEDLREMIQSSEDEYLEKHLFPEIKSNHVSPVKNSKFSILY